MEKLPLHGRCRHAFNSQFISCAKQSESTLSEDAEACIETCERCTTNNSLLDSGTSYAKSTARRKSMLSFFDRQFHLMPVRGIGLKFEVIFQCDKTCWYGEYSP